MIKRILSTMMLLTSLLGGSISKALAANSAKAIWCESNQKLYFVYDNVSYSTGSSGNNTYDGHSITYYWEGSQVTNSANRRYLNDNGVVKNCKKIVIADNFSSAGMTDCWGMFMNLAALESITGLANMITSSVTSMSNMFNGCTNLASINFDGVNTSNATDMQSIFSGCKKLSSLDLTNFDTRKVTVMNNMFKDCENLTSLTLGSNFKTDKIANMSYMFSNCKKLESLDLTNFNTAIVTNMQDMFSNCEQLTSLDVTSFNTSEVTNMSYMFKSCMALTSLNLFSFDVSKVKSMYSMFADCKILVKIYAESNWASDATSLESSTDMFSGCSKLEGKVAWNTNTDPDKSMVKFANLDGYFTSRSSLTMSFSPAGDQTATVGTAFTEPTLSISALGLTDPSTLTITYSSSDPTVATVDAEGEVTILSSGETTITASFAGNSNYQPQNISYKLTVSAIQFGAYIGSVRLTSDHINNSTKLMSDISAILTSGTVSLTANTDYSGLTLTLDNATIKTENSTFSNSGTLAVVLVGNNVLSSESSSAVILSNSGTLTIGGTGKLTLSGSSAGILNNENSSIALNGGTLEMNGTSFGFYGSDNSSLTLNSGTLDMKGGSSGYYGTSSSALTVNDGVLMAKGGTASIRIMKDGQMTLASGVAITQPYGAKWDNSGASTWDVTDATGHTITSQVTIAKGAVAAGLTYSASTGTATYGVAPTSLPTLTNTHSLPITYTSSDPNVATVASDGNVTIVKPGTTTISASFDGNVTYLAGAASYTLTVNKGTPVLSFSETEATATYGTTPNVLSLTVQPEELLSSINYISTIEDKATVGTDKKIQIKKKGLTYIKAIFNASEYYNAADAQYALTINPATATLQFGNDEVNCKVGETISSQTAQTSPGGLTVTYSSNLPSVAGVDETTGKVTASQAGTATITGTVNTDQYYGTKSYQVTITKNANDLAFEKTEVSAAYGDVFTPPTLINPHELGVNYSSSDHSVALVDPISGVVTFKTTGEVDITADFVGNGKYEAGNATYHLTITKKNAALAFAQPTATATYSEAFTEPALTNPNSLTVTYESSEPTVATVATDGKVTVLKTGETTISAKFTGNTLYNASTVSYVLTVNPKTVSSPTITLSATSFTYDGTAKQPTVTVKDGSTTIPASEYTIGYSNNTNVGTATVTITDKTGGNYTVSGSTTFAIAAADGSLTPPVGKTGLVFSGTAQNLITAGSSTTGTVQYSLDGTTYGTAIPQGTDAKEYTIYYKVVAKAGYKDVAPASFKVTISPKTVSSPTITLSATSFTYDGTAKQPTVTVKDGSTTIPASEYTVGYSNNINVGTATVTITDKTGGNYTVSGSTTFAIAAADGSLTPPVGKTGLVFSGTAQNLITAGSSTTGTVQYSLDGTTYGTAIPQGTDAKEYTIYYKVVAKAGYKDVAPASFKVTIAAKSVSSPTITLSATSFAYDGTAKQPTVTVKDGSTTIPASEYTIGYSNNTNVGTATVTITDKTGGNYTVSGSTTFAIAAADGSLTPPVGKTGLVFSGTAQNLITAGSSTTGTVQYSLDGTTYGTAIPQGTDAKEYTIYYKVVAKAGYKDVAPASFKVTIAAKSVSSPTITLSATSFTYDGTAKQPTVTVKDGSTTIPASEYTVGYSNNTNVGTATVTITDKAGGNYTVSGTTTFVIVLRGDANGDNKVDVSDIVEMVNAKAGRASAKFKMANADIDNNGSITETDINAVTRIIMGE